MSKQLSKPGKNIIAVIAVAGLLITLIPSFLHWQQMISADYVHTLMMVGTVIWFIAAILLFGKKPEMAD